MSWVETKNLQTVSLGEIPVLPVEDLRLQTIAGINNGRRLVEFFGDETRDGIALHVVLADDNASRLYVASSKFRGAKAYPSLTPEVPAAHLFES